MFLSGILGISFKEGLLMSLSGILFIFFYKMAGGV